MGGQQLLLTAGLAAAGTAAAAAALVSPHVLNNMAENSTCTEEQSIDKQHADGDAQQQDCDEEAAIHWAQAFLLSLSAQQTAAQLVLNQQWKRCMQSVLPLAAAAAVSNRSYMSERHSASTASAVIQIHPGAGGRASHSCNSRVPIMTSLGDCLPPAPQAAISQPPEQQGGEAVQDLCKSAAPRPMVPVSLTLPDSPQSLHSQEMPARSAASFFLGSQRQHPNQGPQQACQATALECSAVGSSLLPGSEQPDTLECLQQQSYINSKANKPWHVPSSECGSRLGSDTNTSTGPGRCEDEALPQVRSSSSSTDAGAGARGSLSAGPETHISQLALSGNFTEDAAAQAPQSHCLYSTQQQHHHHHQFQQKPELTVMPHQCSMQPLAHISGQLSKVEELSDMLLQQCSSLVAEKEDLGTALQLARAHAQQVEVRHDACLSKLMHTQQQLEQQRMQHKAASSCGMQRLQQLFQQVQTKLQQAPRHKTSPNTSSCLQTTAANAESTCRQSAECQASEHNVALQQCTQQPEHADAAAQLESCIHQLLDQWDQQLAPVVMVQQQVQQLSGELQHATQIAEKAVFEKQQLQRAKSVLQRKLSESQQQLVKQHKALTEVTNNRMAIAAAKTNLHHQLQGLQDSNKQLRDTARQAADASAAQEQKMQQLQQQLDASQAALAAAVSKQQQVEQALKLVQSECENGLYQLAQLHLKLQEAKVEHRREVEQMQEQLDGRTAENLLLAQQLQQAAQGRIQWQHLQDQLASALAAKEDAAQQALAAEEHAQQLQQELATVQAAHERSSLKAGQLQHELTAVRAAQESSSQQTAAQKEQLQQELAAAMAARDSSTADATQLKHRHEQLVADLTRVHRELASTKAAYDGSIQAACELMLQLQQSAALVEQLQQLTTYVPQLQEDLAAATTACNSSAAEAALAKQQLAESADAVSDLQHKLAVVAAARDCNAAETDKLKQQLQQSGTDIQHLQRELAAAQAEHERMTAEAANSAALVQQLQQQLESVTAGREGLELEAGKLKQQVQQLQQSTTDARQLQQELLSARQAHTCAAAEVTQLQQKLEQYAADKQQVQQELTAAGRVAQETLELRQQLQQATADVQRLEQELKAAADAANQQTAVVQLQRQLDEAAFEVKQLQLELSAAKRARDGALTEVSQLQPQLQSATANVKQLKQQLAGTQSGAKLLDQIAQLQLQTTKLTQQHADAEACSKALQEQLHQAQSELKALQDERDLESSQLIAALDATQSRIAGSTQQVAEAQHDVTQLARVVELQQQQLAWQQDTIRRLKSALPHSQLQVLMPDGDDTPWSSTCTSPRMISPGANGSRVPTPFRQPSQPATPYTMQQQQQEVTPALTVVSATCDLPATAGAATSKDLCSQQEPRNTPCTEAVCPMPGTGSTNSADVDSSSGSSSNSTGVRNVANRRTSLVQTASTNACTLQTEQPRHGTDVPCANSVQASSVPEGKAAGSCTTAVATDELDKPSSSSSTALTPSNTRNIKSKRNSRRVSAASSSGGGAIVLPQQNSQPAHPRRTSSSSGRKQGATLAAPASNPTAAAGSRLLQDSLLASCDTKLQLNVPLAALATSSRRPSSAGTTAADESSSERTISLEGAVVMDHKCGWLWAAGAGSASDKPRGGVEVLSAEFGKLHHLAGVSSIGSLSVGGWGQPCSDGDK